MDLKIVSCGSGEDWSKSLRNPNSPIGLRDFAIDEQNKVISQARIYSSALDEVRYHTNSKEFAEHYTQIFNREGINNFVFIITD